jgi:hypothetical protein
MDEIIVLPVYRYGIGEIADGILVKAFDTCKKNCGSEKCKTYYDSIYNVPGFHQCHKGFTSYVIFEKTTKEIYTGFRVKNHYNKRLIPKSSKNIVINPILSEKYFESIMHIINKTEKLQKNYIESTRFIKDVLHEVKSFNAQILAKAEEVEIKMDESSPKVKKKVSSYIPNVKNIVALSYLISTRFSVYDATVNPDVLEYGNKSMVTIYKKFDKIKKCYSEEAQKKSIKTKLIGQSNLRFGAYPIFDILPFLLLQNAIKYSPTGKEIEINFEENKNELKIMIKSYGPVVSKDEIDNIFTKGYRSKLAQKAIKDGSGTGLFLAREICRVHGISIEVTSGNEEFYIKDIPYSIFNVILKIYIQKNSL